MDDKVENSIARVYQSNQGKQFMVIIGQLWAGWGKRQQNSHEGGIALK
jgi:hypothetical protein